MEQIPAPPSAEALEGLRRNGRVRLCCKKPWLGCCAGYEERSSTTGQGSDDPAGLEQDWERNRADNVSLRLYLQGQGSGKTWHNWNSLLKDRGPWGRRCWCCWVGWSTALCTMTMQPLHTYQHLDILPHSSCLTQAQELCTSLGSGAMGLLPFSGRQNLPGI